MIQTKLLQLISEEVEENKNDERQNDNAPGSLVYLQEDASRTNSLTREEVA